MHIGTTYSSGQVHKVSLGNSGDIFGFYWDKLGCGTIYSVVSEVVYMGHEIVWSDVIIVVYFYR